MIIINHMMKYRIIKILSIFTLILLFSALIFPFMRREGSSYSVTFIWIWGFPVTPMEFIFVIPFYLLSIGIIIEMVFLLKSYFILRKDKMELEIISRSWIKRGIHIIVYEFLWILLLFVMVYIPVFIYGDIYFNLYIELPFFFPLVSGLLLITARILSRGLDIRESKNDYVDLQWLETQHYELRKSSQEIANEQNVSMITIEKYIKKIDRKQEDS